jgi:hypothetical protein
VRSREEAVQRGVPIETRQMAFYVLGSNISQENDVSASLLRLVWRRR